MTDVDSDAVAAVCDGVLTELEPLIGLDSGNRYDGANTLYERLRNEGLASPRQTSGP